MIEKLQRIELVNRGSLEGNIAEMFVAYTKKINEIIDHLNAEKEHCTDDPLECPALKKFADAEKGERCPDKLVCRNCRTEKNIRNSIGELDCACGQQDMVDVKGKPSAENFNVSSMDAKVWAKEFMRLYQNSRKAPQNIPDWVDESLMIGWFANAIMAGYDNARLPPALPEKDRQ